MGWLTDTAAEVGFGVSVTPSSVAPAGAVPTLTGEAEYPAASSPALRFGVSAVGLAQLSPVDTLSASGSVWRDQALCDTCRVDGGPGWLGSELLGSSDLLLRLDHWVPADGGGGVVLRAEWVAPASRDALWCNPMLGAPGLGVRFDVPAAGSTVRVSSAARRPLYLNDAAPIGRCAPPLRDPATVDTLTGAAEPTPWTGWYGGSNPRWTGAGSVRWDQPHQVIPGAPAGLRSSVVVGLRFERYPRDPAVVVDTLTGPVELPASNRPVRTSAPWQVDLGFSATPSVEVLASVGDSWPTTLADPGGAFRALPATTTWSLGVTARPGAATTRETSL